MCLLCFGISCLHITWSMRPHRDHVVGRPHTWGIKNQGRTDADSPLTHTSHYVIFVLAWVLTVKKAFCKHTHWSLFFTNQRRVIDNIVRNMFTVACLVLRLLFCFFYTSNVEKGKVKNTREIILQEKRALEERRNMNSRGGREMRAAEAAGWGLHERQPLLVSLNPTSLPLSIAVCRCGCSQVSMKRGMRGWQHR